MSKRNKILKVGYQAPKGRRINNGFNRIGVENMHYCWSHNFWYNTEEQDRLLHEGKPCIHTDYRYIQGQDNFYGEGCMLHVNRHYGISLEAAKRMVRKTKNLPKGTIVEIGHPCYGIGRKKRKKGFSLAYNFKIVKENKFDPKYEVSPEFNGGNFNTDNKARELTDLLRDNGFLVAVRAKNPNFISELISSAAAFTGQNMDVTDEEGEIATAYGHGLRVGYSSNDSVYRGYSCGIKNILFDKWDEFDKWSRCREIPKNKSNEEILKILLNVKNETNEH